MFFFLLKNKNKKKIGDECGSSTASAAPFLGQFKKKKNKKKNPSANFKMVPRLLVNGQPMAEATTIN